MAKETDINFDDDFSEFDDFDFSYDPLTMDMGGSRSAVETIPTAALDAVLNKSTVDAAIASVKEHALPKGYGIILDTVDSAMDTTRSVYDSAVRSLRPAATSVKAMLRSKESAIESLLPTWASKKIKDFAVDDSPEPREYVDPVEAAIKSAMNDVFNRSNQLEVSRAKMDFASDAIKTQRTNVQHGQNIRLLGNISTSISRLVGYQDSILENYHRKDLELQMRQYFILRDMLTVSKASSDITRHQLDGILKNSALPDFAKLKIRENYGQLLQNKLLGKANDKMMNYAGNFGRVMSKKFNTATNNLVENFKDNVLGITDSISDMDGMIPEGKEGEMLLQGITGAITQSIIKKITDYGAKKISSRVIRGNEDLATKSAKFEYLADEMPKIVNEFARGDIKELPFDITDLPGGRLAKKAISKLASKDVFVGNSDVPVLTARQLASGKFIGVRTGKPIKTFRDILDEDGVLDPENGNYEVITPEEIDSGLTYRVNKSESGVKTSVTDFLRDVSPTTVKERSVAHNLADIATEETPFDQLTRRSIIEIIPGYLSRILQQVTAVATGSPAERIIYSPHTESFVTTEENDKDIDNRLFNDEAINFRRSGAGQLINKIDKDGVLSPAAKSALVDKMLVDRDNNERFNFSRYGQEGAFKDLDDETANEIYNFVNSESLNIDDDINPVYYKKFNQLGTLDNAVEDAIVKYGALGDKETLRRLQILKQEKGRDVIDEESLANRFRGYDDDTDTRTFFRDLDKTPIIEDREEASSLMSKFSEMKNKAKGAADRYKRKFNERFNKDGKIEDTLSDVRESIAEISKNISESDAFKQASETATKVKSKIKDITNKDKLKEVIDEIVTSEAVAAKIAELRKKEWMLKPLLLLFILA